MRILTISMIASLVACGGGSNPMATVDAPPATHDAVHADTGGTDAPAMGGTAPVHTLFVNADGVTLVPGSEDDATLDQSAFLVQNAQLLPWLHGAANRAAKIAALVNEMQTTLAPYDITIVTTRPASGDYDMYVLTDSDGTAVGADSGQPGFASASCLAIPKALAVQFAAAYGSYTEQQRQDTFAAYAIATFGMASGIPESKVVGDCMCYSAAECTMLTGACTIGGANTAVNAGMCVAPATMDEAARFLAAFGPHP